MQRVHYFVGPHDEAARIDASWKVARDAETVAQFGTEAEAIAFAIAQAHAAIERGHRAQVHLRSDVRVTTVWTMHDDLPIYTSRP